MAATEKNDVISFTLLDPLSPYKRALIVVDATATVDSGDSDFITLDNTFEDGKARVENIKSVRGHVFETGAPVQYSYDGNVLTKEGGGDTRDVIEILFTSL